MDPVAMDPGFQPFPVSGQVEKESRAVNAQFFGDCLFDPDAVVRRRWMVQHREFSAYTAVRSRSYEIKFTSEAGCFFLMPLCFGFFSFSFFFSNSFEGLEIFQKWLEDFEKLRCFVY